MLAADGAEVVLAVRNPAKGEAAAATLTGTVEVRRLDVADLSSVREFAADIGPVDVLINNAGVLAVPYALTVDGFETHLATNHLGHFALTNLMLPQISDRVVVISSDSHRLGEARPDRPELGAPALQGRSRPTRTSKLANLLFLAELQRRLTAAGSTLRAVGSHPGSTATSITGNTGNAFKTWVGQLGPQARRDAGLEGRADARCTPRPWTSRATPSSAPTASRRSRAGRPASAAAGTRSTPTSPRACGPRRRS